MEWSRSRDEERERGREREKEKRVEKCRRRGGTKENEKGGEAWRKIRIETERTCLCDRDMHLKLNKLA